MTGEKAGSLACCCTTAVELPVDTTCAEHPVADEAKARIRHFAFFGQEEVQRFHEAPPSGLDEGADPRRKLHPLRCRLPAMHRVHC